MSGLRGAGLPSDWPKDWALPWFEDDAWRSGVADDHWQMASAHSSTHIDASFAPLVVVRHLIALMEAWPDGPDDEPPTNQEQP